MQPRALAGAVMLLDARTLSVNWWRSWHTPSTASDIFETRGAMSASEPGAQIALDLLIQK
jgi:hypothetical protein